MNHSLKLKLLPSEFPICLRVTGMVIVYIWVMLVTGCGSRHDSTSPESNTPDRAQQTPVTVKVAHASMRPMPRYLNVTGQLKGNQEALVAANTNGKISVVHVERGTTVNTGDPLAEIDATNAELTFTEAESMVAVTKAQLALANTEFERFEPLAQSKAISDSEFQKIKTERTVRQAAYDSAIAKRNLARKALDDAIIRAPFSGRISDRLVEVGEFVMPPAPVVRLVEVSKLRLVLNVPETAAQDILPDQKVQFKTTALGAESFSGTITFISGALRETARDLIVEALVDNTDLRLKPGYFAEADIRLPDQEVLSIPSDALQTHTSRTSVWVMQDNTLEERLVDLGVSNNGWTEIRNGIQEGTSIVVSPSPSLLDGMKARSDQP